MRWGIVGTGLHAEQRLAPALAQSITEKLGGVVGSSLDKARAFAERIGNARARTNAVASAIGRALDATQFGTVAVLVRSASATVVIEVECRGRAVDPADVELARLLIEGQGGQLQLRTRGSRGTMLSITMPRITEPAARAEQPTAEQVDRSEHRAR